MNKIELEIEKKSYQEVIYQFTKGCDTRMNIKANEFCKMIELRIHNIDIELSKMG
jgi:hypothetical protein